MREKWPLVVLCALGLLALWPAPPPGIAQEAYSATSSRLTDGSNVAGIAPASTAATSAEPALVCALSPNSPLPAGSNAVGGVTATGPAASGNPPIGNPVLVAGSDGTDVRTAATDTAGHLEVAGTGAAGTPAGAVLSVQGESGMTPIVAAGSTAIGGALVGNPVPIAGMDGSNNVHAVATDVAGHFVVGAQSSAGVTQTVELFDSQGVYSLGTATGGSFNPDLIGGMVQAGTQTTEYANGIAASATFDPGSRLYVRTDNGTSNFACSTSGSATNGLQNFANGNCALAPGAGLAYYISSVAYITAGTQNSFTLDTGTGTACATSTAIVTPTDYPYTYGMHQFTFPNPVRVTTNQALCINVGTAATWSAIVTGFVAP